EQPVDRLRDEKCRWANRQAGEPTLSAQRQGSRRSLSPAAAAHAARGTPGAAIRVTQPPAPRRATTELIDSRRTRVTGSGEFGALVRRLAQCHRPTERRRCPRGVNRTDLVVAGRLASLRAHRSRGGSLESLPNG